MTLNRFMTQAGLAAALVALPVSMGAQQQAPVTNPPANPAPPPAAPVRSAQRPDVERVPLTAGRSTVVPTDFDITRIAITDPTIADAVVVQPREILIDGKKQGTVSLIVWSSDRRKQYDVVVEPAITTLEQHLQALFPGENIAISVSEEAIVLSGQVSSTNVMLRAGEIARASATKSKVINLLQVRGAVDDAAVCGAGLRRPIRKRSYVQRLSEPVLLRL
jgi:pilus assembly protein CpaC